MRKFLILATVIACGSTEPLPTRTGAVQTINDQALPAIVYSSGQTVGRVLSGTVTGTHNVPACTVHLTRDTRTNDIASPMPDVDAVASCTWGSVVEGTATIDLPQPWGRIEARFLF